MKAGKRRLMTVIILCIIAMVGMVFAVPEEAAAKSKKPAKVSSFRISATDYNYVALKWNKQKGIKKYQVYRAAKRGGKFKLVKTVTKNTYKDPKLLTGKTYWYKVRAVRGVLKGGFSKTVKATPKLKTPTFNASSRLNGAKLTSSLVKGASGYVFYRDGKPIRVQKGRIYTDTTPKDMKVYTYMVAAYRTVKGKKIYSRMSRQMAGTRITVKVKVEGGSLPTRIKSTSDFVKAGTIKANYPFKAVEIGIVKGDSWVRKYQKKGLNTKSFALSNADSKFNFKGLPAGTYKYRIYVHFEGGIVHTVQNHKFTVEMGAVKVSASAKKGIAGAIAWAKAIAADDSFTYGAGKQAHKRGCYFCGTNKRFKPKGYERTYCCNPFIFAAYAHGAKDPKILKACKKGACGGMLPSDWTKYGCFVTVGKTKEVPFDELKTGDVIISRKSDGGPCEHVWMYTGGNELVEASGGGWGAGSIAVKQGAEKKYKRYRRNGCHVMRYIGN